MTLANYKLMFSSTLLLLLSGQIHAASFHSLEEIRNTAKQFILTEMQSQFQQSELEVSVRPLDPRLKLKQCNQALDASLPQYNRRSDFASVMISCNSSASWSLYVPVKISRYIDVLVYTRPLQRHDILSAEDVEFMKMNISRLNGGYSQDRNAVIGKVMQQNKMPGNVVLNTHYKTPLMVKRGEEIVLLSKSSSIEVRMKGTALAQGSMGDKIRVRNLRSKRIVNGTIIGPGIISVDS